MLGKPVIQKLALSFLAVATTAASVSHPQTAVRDCYTSWMPSDQPGFQNDVSDRPASISWKLFVWAVLLSFGVFGYMHISNKLRHDMFAFIEFSAVFPTILFITLGPATFEGKAWKKLVLLWLISFASCFLMLTRVIKSEGELMRYPTPELIHQFGLRSVVFFIVVFFWVFVTPRRGSREANFARRKFQLGVTVAVALLQTIFGVQFLRELWVATSIDQVRVSVRLLLYTGLALYLFLLVKILPPRTTSNEEKVVGTGS